MARRCNRYYYYYYYYFYYYYFFIFFIIIIIIITVQCCSKLINFSEKDTIHEQAINKPSKPGANLSVYQCHENLTLAIRSAQAIGCNVVNIGCDDLYEGKEHIVLGLMWQVIRVSSR